MYYLSKQEIKNRVELVLNKDKYSKSDIQDTLHKILCNKDKDKLISVLLLTCNAQDLEELICQLTKETYKVI